MIKLDAVKIDATYRIAAATALLAATSFANTLPGRQVVSIDASIDDKDVFIIQTDLRGSFLVDVVFVELVSKNKYRVEAGEVRFTDIELLQAIGGDDAVNETGHYAENDGSKSIITNSEYNSELKHWVADDAITGAGTRMADYFKRKFSAVIMVNGVFSKDII